MSRSFRAALRLTAIFSVLAFAGVPAHAQQSKASTKGSKKAQAATPASNGAAPDSAFLATLKWRFIGPEGNRTDAIAGVPGDPNTYYAGAASGGLWKSTDGGAHWNPIFDDQPVQSIGSIAVAPSDPNVVYVGTGEPYLRSHVSVGWGMFKSTDAGKTWSRAGLEKTGRISRIAIDPSDPNRLYVAALGTTYGPEPDRGVFRSTDGGKTWDKVLFVNDSTGAVDVLLDPRNPRILYASTWQVETHTWGRESGGAGSGIWKSTDGGTTWTRLTGHGLPTRQVGKVTLGISPANTQRIYAQIETGDGVPWHGVPTDTGRLWRSDDAGSSWKLVNSDLQPMGRTAYYSRMGVMPDNADEVYFLASDFTKTLDGGVTMIDLQGDQFPRGDHHDIWIDPTNGNRFAVAHDGGVAITMNRGKNFLRVQLPIAQVYHVTVDNRVPYDVYGNKQDGTSYMGPSDSKLGAGGGIWRGLWRNVGGGESGFAIPDTVDTNLVWSSASGSGAGGGIVVRYDVATGIVNNVEVWPDNVGGDPASMAKYRFVWNFPLMVSPHDHNTVYTGSQMVHRTTNGGQSWDVISPDLTRNDKTKQGISGGLTPDNIGVEYADVIYWIAESPLARGELWVGTNDGLAQVTRDDGKTWTNVTHFPGGAPALGTVSSIEPSRFTAGTAYLTIDGHQVNDFDPWVYRTTDWGKTWTLITHGIAKTPLSYAHSIYEDPARKGLLYLGTEGNVYVSFDAGDNWVSLQNNLPHAPVYGITVQPHYQDLVVGTYGRGFWILDDLTPLHEWNASLPSKPLALLEPRPQYRYRGVAEPATELDDIVAGKNPADGATLDYWLATAPKDTTDSAKVTIAANSGTVVRTMKVRPHAGLNRIQWDLYGDETKEARLRASPLYMDWFHVKASGIPSPSVGRFALLEPPGTYTVTVSLDDLHGAQKLTVLEDPAAGGTEQTIAAQNALERGLYADINDAVDQINAMEVVRAQVEGLLALAGKDTAFADVRSASDSLRDKLVAVEQQLFQMKITGRGQDDVRWPPMLTERLMYLAGEVQRSDQAPTDQAKQVAELLHGQLLTIKGQVAQFLKTDVTAFNDKLRGRNVHPIVGDVR
ncbi:MAG TPA: hypothetical protein VJO52_16190 [Gemmatimonadaceae bacterium]|nr:hypothetical protein [Gemmatimonadaceae bacterium]